MKATLMLFIELFLVLIAGCAISPSYLQRANTAVNSGDLESAERLYMQEIQSGSNPGAAWNNLGVLYGHQKKVDAAMGAFTMGARWGNAYAQQNLVKFGRPVPNADLLQAQNAQKAQSDAEFARLLSINPLLNQSPTPPIPPTIDCTSTMMDRNTITTNCNQF